MKSTKAPNNPTTPERRRARSAQPALAIELYLRTLAQQSNATLMAIADDQGILISGVGGPQAELESLAALSTLTPKLQRAERDRSLKHQQGALHAHSIEAMGRVFWLASVGGSAPRVADAAGAVARILG